MSGFEPREQAPYLATHLLAKFSQLISFLAFTFVVYMQDDTLSFFFVSEDFE
jgi:hypothetical protein